MMLPNNITAWDLILQDSATLYNFNVGFNSMRQDIIIHLSQWQYWWWFWFSLLWTIYYFLTIRLINKRVIYFNPIVNTSLRSHAKWGDFLIAILPLTWCGNILINSNFILRMIEFQNESSLFTLRVQGKQWYWVYKYDFGASQSVLTAPMNIGNGHWLVKKGNYNYVTDSYQEAVTVSSTIEFDIRYRDSIKNKKVETLDETLSNESPFLENYIDKPYIKKNMHDFKNTQDITIKNIKNPSLVDRFISDIILNKKNLTLKNYNEVLLSNYTVNIPNVQLLKNLLFLNKNFIFLNTELIPDRFFFKGEDQSKHYLASSRKKQIIFSKLKRKDHFFYEAIRGANKRSNATCAAIKKYRVILVKYVNFYLKNQGRNITNFFLSNSTKNPFIGDYIAFKSLFYSNLNNYLVGLLQINTTLNNLVKNIGVINLNLGPLESVNITNPILFHFKEHLKTPLILNFLKINNNKSGLLDISKNYTNSNLFSDYINANYKDLIESGLLFNKNLFISNKIKNIIDTNIIYFSLNKSSNLNSNIFSKKKYMLYNNLSKKNLLDDNLQNYLQISLDKKNFVSHVHFKRFLEISRQSLMRMFWNKGSDLKWTNVTEYIYFNLCYNHKKYNFNYQVIPNEFNSIHQSKSDSFNNIPSILSKGPECINFGYDIDFNSENVVKEHTNSSTITILKPEEPNIILKKMILDVYQNTIYNKIIPLQHSDVFTLDNIDNFALFVENYKKILLKYFEITKYIYDYTVPLKKKNKKNIEGYYLEKHILSNIKNLDKNTLTSISYFFINKFLFGNRYYNWDWFELVLFINTWDIKKDMYSYLDILQITPNVNLTECLNFSEPEFIYSYSSDVSNLLKKYTPKVILGLQYYTQKPIDFDMYQSLFYEYVVNFFQTHISNVKLSTNDMIATNLVYRPKFFIRGSLMKALKNGPSATMFRDNFFNDYLFNIIRFTNKKPYHTNWVLLSETNLEYYQMLSLVKKCIWSEVIGKDSLKNKFLGLIRLKSNNQQKSINSFYSNFKTFKPFINIAKTNMSSYLYNSDNISKLPYIHQNLSTNLILLNTLKKFKTTEFCVNKQQYKSLLNLPLDLIDADFYKIKSPIKNKKNYNIIEDLKLNISKSKVLDDFSFVNFIKNPFNKIENYSVLNIYKDIKGNALNVNILNEILINNKLIISLINRDLFLSNFYELSTIDKLQYSIKLSKHLLFSIDNKFNLTSLIEERFKKQLNYYIDLNYIIQKQFKNYLIPKFYKKDILHKLYMEDIEPHEVINLNLDNNQNINKTPQHDNNDIDATDDFACNMRELESYKPARFIRGVLNKHNLDLLNDTSVNKLILFKIKFQDYSQLIEKVKEPELFWGFRQKKKPTYKEIDFLFKPRLKYDPITFEPIGYKDNHEYPKPVKHYKYVDDLSLDISDEFIDVTNNLSAQQLAQKKKMWTTDDLTSVNRKPITRDPFDFYESLKYNKKHSELVPSTLARRLLRTKRTLVLPAHVNITIITNSYDVVHSWFIPGLGLKLDCVPGRSTHHSLYIDTVGFYYGQCAEVCGRYHHHMPIKVCVLPFEHFIFWWKTRGIKRMERWENSNFVKEESKPLLKKKNLINKLI